MKKGYLVLLALLFAFSPQVLLASDHADPIFLGDDDLEGTLTGLFVFPDGDQMIVILGVRRALTAPPPYENLENYEYSIFMDLDSPVSFANAEDLARYGGTVTNPAGISPEVRITFQLNPDTTIKKKDIQGLKEPFGIRITSGVFDDPFILPRFFGTNVVAMVLSIPMSSFPGDQETWLLWATSTRLEKFGRREQVDHVGRSNRTMLPRFDFLNTIPPNEQTAAIMKRHDDPGLIDKVLMEKAQPFFAIRHYDYPPDVMIYTKRRPVGFPNGRRLTDDVADLTCRQGDCLLWELSFADTEEWPRRTTNDRPFRDEFPYLAEPWPPRQ